MAGVEDGPLGAELGHDQILEVELVVGQLLPHLVEDLIVEAAEGFTDLDPFGHLGRGQRAALQLDEAVLEGQLGLIVAAAGGSEQGNGHRDRGDPPSVGTGGAGDPPGHQATVAWGWFSRTPFAVTRMNSALAQNSSMVLASL